MNDLQDYSKILQAIKSEIKVGQHRAFIAVNKELILLYWNIGRIILKHQYQEGWGSKVIDKLEKIFLQNFPI